MKFGKQFKLNVKFILHWKIFDMMEYPTGDWEVSIFFIKIASLSNGRLTYYVDSCGIGLEFLSNKVYTNVAIKLIAFSIEFQFKKKHLLKVA